MQKKLAGCNTNEVIEMKDHGKQMVMTCSTAFYEVLKQETLRHFEEINTHNDSVAVEIRDVRDSTGLLVEHVLRVTNRLKLTETLVRELNL